MRKTLILSIIGIALVIFGIQQGLEDIGPQFVALPFDEEEIDIDLYEVLYTDTEFDIYILKEIPYIMYTGGISYEELDNDVCYLSITTPEYAYVVLYDGEYYDLSNSFILGLFDTYELISYGVLFDCHPINPVTKDSLNCSVYDIPLKPEYSEWIKEDGSMTNSFLEDESIALMNGYYIYRQYLVCDMVVGNLIVDGYYFGHISSGCTFDLDSIGYYAMKDDVRYSIQDLVDDGEIEIAEVYNMYVCDPSRIGTYSEAHISLHEDD